MSISISDLDNLSEQEAYETITYLKDRLRQKAHPFKEAEPFKVASNKRIRIEFNDITDVPEVYIDGNLINPLNGKNGLVSLNINWLTDDTSHNNKSVKIKWLTENGIKKFDQSFKPWRELRHD